jgi:hypothetical protein
MTVTHIREPISGILKVLEVVYFGNRWDEAVEQKLNELGAERKDFRTIICIPTDGKPEQLSLF